MLIHVILAGMDSVVNHPGGTGKRGALKGIRVGGKTGSGEWKKGEKTHAWFAAVAPLYAPEIAVSVILESERNCQENESNDEKENKRRNYNYLLFGNS